MSNQLKFRKKPIVVEAFQMTKERRWDNSDWPEWLHEAWNKGEGEGALFVDQDHNEDESKLCIEDHNEDDSRLRIGTKEGVHRVSWNDWIVRGVALELYPCKPDIFLKTYDPA